MLVALSAILAYALSLPLGVVLGSSGSALSKWLRSFLFLNSILPVFALALVLVALFANSSAFNIFPASGLESMRLEEGRFASWRYYVLPVLSYSLGIFTTLTLLVSDKVTQAKKELYFTAAIAKGLTSQKIRNAHLRPLAMVPLVASFAGLLPALLAGSVVIEVIFGIPGLGRLLVFSANAGDLPVLRALILLYAAATIVGYQLSDVLLQMVDPKVEVL